MRGDRLAEGRRRRARRATITAAVLSIALGATAGLAAGRARQADTPGFPHARHAKLFPTCVGCHEGMTTGDTAAMFPPASSCANCHDGRRAKPVAWRAAAIAPTNLRFDHRRHARLTDSAGTRVDCLTCHAAGGAGAARAWMVVGRAQPATCLDCHAHAASSHLAADSRCETCHVPLARAVALSDSDVAHFPKPPSHAAPDFLAAHGRLAAREIERCATCHAQESCARCHVNAATLRPIAQLASDPRVARLVRDVPATYPVPASHRRAGFATEHGALAEANVRRCATCHAQESCRACHIGRLGSRTIEQLPRVGPGGARGVQLRPPRPGAAPAWPTSDPAGEATPGAVRAWSGSLAGVARTPAMLAALRELPVDTPPPPAARPDTARVHVVRVHPADFVRTHGPIAASGRLDCAGCHQERFCVSCHQSIGERNFHPFDFVARHASEAQSGEMRCTSCHNTEVFCRSCHREVGLGAGSSRRSGTAHAGQPLWLLQHGQAARQGMQSCASCHQQTDCMQCHSTVSGRVNPHGPSFDPGRMSARNKVVCSFCHVGGPP